MTTEKSVDRVAEAHERLVAQVEALVSGEDWAAMLATASRFHRYSWGNVLLILAQCPEATQVAGYRAWQAMGRQVRKGETGLRILAPCTYRPKRDDEGSENDGDRPEPAAPVGEGKAPARRVRGWRTVSVFDVSQTDGEPLAEPVSPVLLAGDPPTELYGRLAGLIQAAGFRLERGDCGQANGWTDFDTRVVRVRSDVDGAQAAKTLAHELAHVLLHGPERTDRGSRERCEVEAESVAFIVCSAAGLATGGYSFPYVARWAGGDLAVVQATGARVMATATRVLAEAGIGAETGSVEGRTVGGEDLTARS